MYRRTQQDSKGRQQKGFHVMCLRYRSYSEVLSDVGKETTVVPATEGSAGRTGRKPPPHPLCDKIQYCAADYQEFGGGKEPFFAEYIEQLQRWDAFDSNPKVHAVLAYVRKRTVVGDLSGGVSRDADCK